MLWVPQSIQRNDVRKGLLCARLCVENWEHKMAQDVDTPQHTHLNPGPAATITGLLAGRQASK